MFHEKIIHRWTFVIFGAIVAFIILTASFLKHTNLPKSEHHSDFDNIYNMQKWRFPCEIIAILIFSRSV